VPGLLWAEHTYVYEIIRQLYEIIRMDGIILEVSF